MSHGNGEAETVVKADEALFHRLVSGEQNAMAALLRGTVDVEGRVQLLAQFQRLLPGPPKRRRRRPASGSARSKR